MTEKMDVLEIVLPVLVMIILGMLCRKWTKRRARLGLSAMTFANV